MSHASKFTLIAAFVIVASSGATLHPTTSEAQFKVPKKTVCLMKRYYGRGLSRSSKGDAIGQAVLQWSSQYRLGHKYRNWSKAISKKVRVRGQVNAWKATVSALPCG